MYDSLLPSIIWRALTGMFGFLNSAFLRLIRFSRVFSTSRATFSFKSFILTLSSSVRLFDLVLKNSLSSSTFNMVAVCSGSFLNSFFKKLTAQAFYRFINFLSDTQIPDDVGDFRLLDREVVDFLKGLPEQSRFLRGLVAWSGFPASYVTFERQKRHAGETHYPFSKMLNFALEGIASFSVKPLRLSIYLGFIASALSILVIAFKSVQHFIFHQGDWLPGWASLFFSIVFLGGIQLITIGIIGEYVGKIYKEVQKRPQFLIKEKINL